MKARYALTIAIALLLGCQPQPAPTSVKPKTTGSATKPKPSDSPSIVPTDRPIPLSEPQRVVVTGTQAVQLIGKVKLISDKGLGVISNNSGGLISNNGGGIISDNGASLIGKTKYDVLQAGGTSALPEASLAQAQIEVLDAAGQVLVTADNQPITATTDASGNYSLKADLPAESLLLRVRLYQGGQLFSFITKDKVSGTVNVDTASSLGAAYVMDKYVKKTQAVLNLLPGTEAEKLQADMEAARVHLTAMPSYQPADLVNAAEQLRTKAPALDETIKRIEAILVAGQKNLGEGLQATQVALAGPAGVAADAQGNIYVSEAAAGRIRKIATNGTMTPFAGTGAPAPRDGILGSVRQLDVGPDGSLYGIKRLANQVVKFPPTGAPVVIAGNGLREQGPLGGKADMTALQKPEKLCIGPDGTIYFSESNTRTKMNPRLLYVDAAGLLQQVPMPEARWVKGEINAFTIGKDGTIWLIGVEDGAKKTNFLARLKKGGSWEFLQDNWPDDADVDMRVGPDGTLYVSRANDAKIFKYDAQGQPTLFAGADKVGFAGDGGPATQASMNGPRSLCFTPDGTLVVADEGNGLVRTIATNGTIKTIAGTTGLTQVGDALTVSINQPGGLALDAQGRLLVAEAASHTVKRLDGNQLTIVAGTTAGFSGDGGPATAAALFRPNGLTFHNGELYILDNKNYRLRKVDAQGVITTLAGGDDGNPTMDRTPALEAHIDSPVNVAFSPLDGLPYWTSNGSHVIMRLKDGFVERVAGQLGGVKGDKGDGGKAIDCELNSPSGMVFDKAGNLYVVDSGNLKVRKIDTNGIITTIAGVDKNAMIALVLSGKGATQNNEPATQSVLWGPFGLLVDDAGNLFISEAGTVTLTAYGDTSGGGRLGFDSGSLPAEMMPKTYARIRKLTPDGKLVNVTGPGTPLLSDTSGDNMLLLPVNLILDAQGRMVIADGGLNQLKVLPKGSF